MKISKELLEKYHMKACSQQEAELVEAWLFSGDHNEALQLPLTEDKAMHKADIWKEIENSMISEDAKPIETKYTRLHKTSFWFGAVAASLFFALLFAGIYHNTSTKQDQDLPFVAVNNTSMQVRHIDANAYHISVGPNTLAKINNTTGIIDLSGSLLISPKKDIVLTFEGNSEKMTFKAGQTYIILKGEDGTDKVIIVNERNIMDLPPVLQKQIINEFKI